MTKRGRSILMRKGFNIFRMELSGGKTIVQATPAGGWKIYGKYETKAASQRAWAELLKDENNLED